jgi:WD40 repeat protein
MIFSAGKDGFVKVWIDGQVALKRLAHAGGVWDIHEKEGILASVGNDFSVKLWKIDGFVLEKEIPIRTRLAFKVKILSNNRILLPFDDKSIRIFNLLTGISTIFIRENVKKAKEIGFSKTHRFLLLRKGKNEFSTYKVPK